MATTAKDITFVIPGELQAAGAGSAPSSVAARGSLKASVRVGAQRGSGEPVGGGHWGQVCQYRTSARLRAR